MIRKIVKQCFFYAVCLSFWGSSCYAAVKTVFVTQIIAHPALNAVRQSLQDALTHPNDDPSVAVKIVYENAQGSIPLAVQIAQKFAAGKADAIVAISTPSAQTLKAALRGKTPLVFAALTDPVAAKLLKNVERPETNITGVTDLPPFDKQMAFIQKVVPHLTSLGVLYNPGEANAVASVIHLKKVLTSLKVTLFLAAVPRSSDVGQATKRLLKDVDAIYIPNDNTVVSGLEAAVRICHEARMPLFAADIMLVQKGLVGMIGFDYHAIGRQTARMVQRLLKGACPESLPVEHPTELTLVLNPKAAAKMGVSFSKALLSQADVLGE